MMTRRWFIKGFGTLSLCIMGAHKGFAQMKTDLARLKIGYALRLKKILAAGELPYIDIESSCNSTKVDIDFMAKSMDSLNIGLMALSADIGKGMFKKGVRYDDLSERLIEKYPDRFIPVGNGGQPPALAEAPGEFLDAQEKAAQSGRIALFGEFEFRHYPSPRQVKRGELDRDVSLPIDGPVGRQLFKLSEKYNLPIQLHYEVEDGLLAPLENMLLQYPKANVIWCHFAQIRYIERAPRFTPAYADSLLKRFPNLYFDTAFGDAQSMYPLSGQRHARVWGNDGNLRPEWRGVIVSHPRRFLSALDLGGDRLEQIREYDFNHRRFLKRLPDEIRRKVAFRNAWLLLFGEEFA
jgi:predicted TIM-barrel fold metal-dependent hydrolase